MARKFSRHEQFLRIYTLLEILSNAHLPLPDDVLIDTLRDRLGLSRLSARTLRRDCEFLTSCGYPVDHLPLPQERKYGWKLDFEGPLAKKLLAEPLTVLELVAFQLARSHLQPYEGTPLWTGIEMLRSRFDRCVPAALKAQMEEFLSAFRVQVDGSKRYSARPRLVSTLAAAVVACRPIDLRHHADGEPEAETAMFEPHLIVIENQRFNLFGYSENTAMIVPVDHIRTCTLRDGSFRHRDSADRDLAALRDRA